MSKPLPEPREVRATFSRLMALSPERAVAYLHNLGKVSGYLKAEQPNSSIRWTSESPYGTLECSINLTKPEKDPRAIAAASNHTPAAPANAHTPQCDLCWENEGWAGSPEHPAKPGLRIAAIELQGERWGLQFSPYAYFPEHCIVLSAVHRPMLIDVACFERLLSFVDLFPFYFIGSNADLPIVGGSILSHDHFQGGRHVFPLMRAPIEREVNLSDAPQVTCGMVRWPASVLRLVSPDRAALVQTAARVLNTWQTFSHEPCGIVARDENGPHNTLNPIVHREGENYVMDLVLRNNRTNDAHPWGIFHPGEQLHHIKKENIGLIEIMGLAILPPRLARELPAVQDALVEAARQGQAAAPVEAALSQSELTASHAPWAADVLTRRREELAHEESAANDLGAVMQEEVGSVFTQVLEATGVFKRDATGEAGWEAFIAALRQTSL